MKQTPQSEKELIAQRNESIKNLKESIAIRTSKAEANIKHAAVHNSKFKTESNDRY